MRQFVYLLFALIFVVGCDNGANQISGPEPEQETEESPTIDAQTRAIVQAAREVAPIDASEGLTVGVLDEEKTSTHARVAYFNDSVYEVYNFDLDESKWKMGERTRQVEFESSLAKYAYTKKYAKLYSNGQDRDTWHVPSNITDDGTYHYSEEYQTNLPDEAQFFEDSEVDDNEEVEIFMSFEGPWKWERFDKPTGSSQSCSLNPALLIFSDSAGEYHPAQKAEVWYTLSSSDVSAPSAPSLNSPTGGALTGASVTFSWGEPSGGGNITYQLQIDDNSNFSSPSVDVSDLSNTSKSESALTRGMDLYWRVRATNTAGTGPWSSVRSIHVRPEVPAVTKSINSNDHPVLSWGSADGATSYQIYREHSKSGAGWELWAETSNTSYTDTNAQVQSWDGRTPYIRYKVRAKDASGEVSYFSQNHYYSEKGINPASPIGGGGD